MKIYLKTTKNDVYKIEVSPEEPISNLKKRIEGLYKYPLSQLKLIYKGKFLENNKKLSYYNVSENDNIVIYIENTKVDASDQAPTSEKLSGSSGVAVSQSTTHPARQNVASPSVNARHTQENLRGTVANSEQETTIQRIVDMGFDREKVILALDRSFQNSERAVQYLVSGDIPDTDEDFSQAESAYLSTTPQNPQAQNTSRPNGSNFFEYLASNEQLDEIRNQILENPEILEQLLQNLSETEPNIISLINDNLDEFMRFIQDAPQNRATREANALENSQSQSEIRSTDENMGDDQMEHQYSSVSEEENEAIQRLCSLGFERHKVIIAFLACDKDEQMAANYLLEGHDD